MKKTAVTLFLAFCSLPALADWKDEVSPAKLGPQKNIVPQEFDYRLSWKGMVDAGKLTFSFGKPDPKNPADYLVRVSGGSSGLAAKLYKHKVSLISRLDPATLRPRVSIGVQDEGDEMTSTRSTWTGTLISSEQTLTLAKNGKSATAKTELRFTPVYDICSAMLYVRSQKLDNGDKLVLPILPFDKPYLMRIEVLGREQFSGRDTIKLSVGLEKIDPATMTLLPYKKFKSATMWLSDDANRIPVELRSEVFIGDVRMTLAADRKL